MIIYYRRSNIYDINIAIRVRITIKGILMVNTKSIGSFYPMIHKSRLPAIKLDNKVWWFGRRMCRVDPKYLGDAQGAYMHFQTTIKFLAFGGILLLKDDKFIEVLSNPCKILATASMIYGLFNIVISMRLQFIDSIYDMKNAFVDIVGGAENFKRLPMIYIKDNEPEHCLYIIRTNEECDEMGLYGDAIVIVYTIAREASIKKVKVLFELDSIFDIVKNPHLERHDMLSWEMALLLKELIITGRCDQNPINPQEKATVTFEK